MRFLIVPFKDFVLLLKRQFIAPLLILAILLSGFIPVTHTQSVSINAPFFNIYQQINTPANWLKWQPQLKAFSRNLKIDSSKSGFAIKSNSFEVNLQRIGIGEFIVTETTPQKTNTFSYTILPETSTERTVCVIKTKTNVYGYLWSGLKDRQSVRSPLSDLKNYLEDTRQYYGFLIEKKQMANKLMAVKRGRYQMSDVYSQTQRSMNEVYKFIKGSNLKIAGALQLQTFKAGQDSVEVMIGLPVNRKVPVTNEIQYMNIPGGNVLVGSFKGKYENKQKLYLAMRQYVNDNYLHTVILPMEIFKGDKLPVSDSTVVTMQVIIPYI